MVKNLRQGDREAGSDGMRSSVEPGGDIRDTMQQAYAKWAGVYDFVYGALLRPGQKSAIAAGLGYGEDILEVGVGTGLSLDLYPGRARVTGVDLSPDMLSRAEARRQKKGLSHVEHLAVMDAMALDFADASFDAVLAQYVLTLVPDADTALDEFARVTRPGGGIIIVSHLGATDGLVADVENRIAPLARKIGWSSDFKLSRITNWAERTGLATLVSVRSMPPAGFFKVVELRRSDRPWSEKAATPH
jgi:phosphatidylethanolamine/phosphatidyl-N-methylethanolamine N-methyltransferase